MLTKAPSLFEGLYSKNSYIVKLFHYIIKSGSKYFKNKSFVTF